MASGRDEVLLTYADLKISEIASAKLAKSFLLRTFLSTLGGCSARSLAWNESVKISSESDILSAFSRMLRI